MNNTRQDDKTHLEAKEKNYEAELARFLHESSKVRHEIEQVHRINFALENELKTLEASIHQLNSTHQGALEEAVENMVAKKGKELKQRRKRMRNKRQMDKKQQEDQIQRDHSEAERMGSADEGLLWLLENNFSLSDYEKWDRFASQKLPHTKYNLMLSQERWRKKEHVKARLTSKNNGSLSYTYIDFIQEVTLAIDAHSRHLPSGKVRVCLRGDGRVHHGNKSVIILFSLPDIPDPQSNVS